MWLFLKICIALEFALSPLLNGMYDKLISYITLLTLQKAYSFNKCTLGHFLRITKWILPCNKSTVRKKLHLLYILPYLNNKLNLSVQVLYNKACLSGKIFWKKVTHTAYDNRINLTNLHSLYQKILSWYSGTKINSYSEFTVLLLQSQK